MGMKLTTPARRTHEDEHELPGHVEGSDQSGHQTDHPKEAEPTTTLKSNTEDLIFDQNPARGGTPAIARVPTAIVAAVTGMCFRSPPILRMSCSL